MTQGYGTEPAAVPHEERTSLLRTPPVAEPMASDPGTTPAAAPRRSTSAGRAAEHHGERVQPEAWRRHPVAYAALALSLIALLWLALTSGSHDSYQRVRVGTQDCLSVPQDSGPAVLYCRANPAVK